MSDPIKDIVDTEMKRKRIAKLIDVATAAAVGAVVAAAVVTLASKTVVYMPKTDSNTDSEA